MSFNFDPSLEGFDLTARPIAASDLGALRDAAADPKIWEGHPAKTRHEPEVFNPYFEFLLGAGGTLIIRESATDGVIGCSRYYVSPNAPDDISIGFTFLIRDHWGGATNFNLKRLMLAHIFAGHAFAWFHIDPNNIRSQKATAKLGAVHTKTAALDLGTGEVEWMCYRLSRADWERTVAVRNPIDAP